MKALCKELSAKEAARMDADVVEVIKKGLPDKEAIDAIGRKYGGKSCALQSSLEDLWG